MYNKKLDRITSEGLNITDQTVPKLVVRKIGVISRDYREAGGISDFDDCLEDVLKFFDSKECDTVIFSLFTILSSHFGGMSSKLDKLKFIKSLFIEEFTIHNKIRYAGNYHCLYRENERWNDYVFYQKFATVTYTNEFKIQVIQPFIKEIASKRQLGHTTVLLCGETNGVKYDKAEKKIVDQFGILKAISPETRIILNPVHDKMTRFEMKLKRAFLSNHNRLVISVWNKGKTDRNGVNRDGENPPWTIFSNGKEINLTREKTGNFGHSNKGLEIGILDVSDIFPD